jgi:hypothetical protein
MEEIEEMEEGEQVEEAEEGEQVRKRREWHQPGGVHTPAPKLRSRAGRVANSITNYEWRKSEQRRFPGCRRHAIPAATIRSEEVCFDTSASSVEPRLSNQGKWRKPRNQKMPGNAFPLQNQLRQPRLAGLWPE